jgi:hypothetical protein
MILWLDLNWKCYAKITIKEKEHWKESIFALKKSWVVENVWIEIVKCHWFDERAMK